MIGTMTKEEHWLAIEAAREKWEAAERRYDELSDVCKTLYPDTEEHANASRAAGMAGDEARKAHIEHCIAAMRAANASADRARTAAA